MRACDLRAPQARPPGVELLEPRTMFSAGHAGALASRASALAGTAPAPRVRPFAPRKPTAGVLPSISKTKSPNAPSNAPTQPPLIGDINGDGKVDVADFKIVNDHLGKSGMTFDQGDVTGDGKVDFTDFQLVEANFGKVLPRYNYATIGQNLDGIADYGTIGAFGDLTRVFRQWGRIETPYQSDLTIQRTADNYPLEDAGAMTYALAYPDGIYQVSWDGQADLNFTGMGSVLTITSHEGDHWTADLSLDHSQGEILNAYVTHVNAADPLHNLHIMSPDMDYNLSDTFRPVFLEKIQQFNGPIRMMDWMQTNWNPAVEWSDRTSPTRFSNANPTGVDYESIIRLANTVHKDIWINVPYHASDDYIKKMALLFKFRLDPSLKLYVEFSNEIWNSGTFQQALDNTALARSDADLTATDDFARSAQEAGKQIARASTIFKQVDGDVKFAQQIRPVLGGFIATTYWSQTALNFIQSHYGDPKNYVSAIAIAPYVGVEGDMAGIDNETLTAEGLFDWMNSFIDQRIAPWVAAHKALADRFGLGLMAYEGGQSLQALNGQNIDLKAAAQDDPRMGDVYTHLIRVWYDNSGGGIFENFSLATPNTNYGYWGLLQTITQPDSVKWDAIMQAMA